MLCSRHKPVILNAIMALLVAEERAKCSMCRAFLGVIVMLFVVVILRARVQVLVSNELLCGVQAAALRVRQAVQ